MARKRITKRAVDALSSNKLIWDTDVVGFGARRQRTAKVYLVKYRWGRGSVWHRIGRHGSPWTPEKARTEAKRILGMVADGKDPHFRPTHRVVARLIPKD